MLSSYITSAGISFRSILPNIVSPEVYLPPWNCSAATFALDVSLHPLSMAVVQNVSTLITLGSKLKVATAVTRRRFEIEVNDILIMHPCFASSHLPVLPEIMLKYDQCRGELKDKRETAFNCCGSKYITLVGKMKPKI